MIDLDRLDFAKGGGLVTVVAQDAATGAVLMVAHADREALERTLASGEMHYRSRTRGAWHKGATSGNVQRVVELLADCDGDAVLARVAPAGPACHTGGTSCFGEPAPQADALAALDATIARRLAESHPAIASGIETTRSEGPPASRDSRVAAPDAHRSGAADIGSSRPEGPPASRDSSSASAPPHPSAAPATERPPSYTRRLLDDRNLRLKKIGEEGAELIAACADGDRDRAVEEMADLLYHGLVALHAVGGTLDDVRRALAARRR